MSTDARGWAVRLRDRVLSDDPLVRAMSYQSVLSAFAEGTFLAGSAVYLIRVVGLTGTEVGLGLTVAGLVTFLVAVPLGRLADRVGTRRTWILGSLAQALVFAAWPLAGGLASFLVVAVALEVAESWARSGRNAYRFAVFPRETRVRSLAYMRAARNVGYSLGALAAGLALAAPGLTLVQALPLLTAAVLLVNTVLVARLPVVREPGREAAARPSTQGEARAWWRRTRDPRRALANRGFLLTSVLDGVLGSHQVLLNVVVPVWVVQETDAPRELVAVLFGLNTVMAVTLQVAASRGVADVASSLRSERRGAACLLLSFLVLLTTHETLGWATVLLLVLGHVTITGSELWQSAGQWGLQAELSDPERRGEYQGVAQLGYTAGNVWAPAAFTWLTMGQGTWGWGVLLALVVVAAVGLHPAARAAERHLARVAPEPARV
ncbi:MFS transporter [Nocardioides bruguierae]|uniref:MFS transporter n=1 Tax=Nocardioides bruguierae TaxID=2945102 RepID=UPI00202076EA|nr:MFS transporter [Nocardioides bruguierae]MCL8027017.1 MFS transporter [Nocardioides bruguierae]